MKRILVDAANAPIQLGYNKRVFRDDIMIIPKNGHGKYWQMKHALPSSHPYNRSAASLYEAITSRTKDTALGDNQQPVFSDEEQLRKFLSSIDISIFTTARNAFRAYNYITSAPLFDTSKIADMSNMFNGCSSLTTVPQYDTSNVTNMANMFYGCTSLREIPLFNNISNVGRMDMMFRGCTSLTTVPPEFLSGQRALNVGSMISMFAHCSGLTEATISGFFLEPVNGGTMFYGCTSLKEASLSWNIILRNAERLFWGCTALTTVNIFEIDSEADVTDMFKGCVNLTNLTIEKIDFDLTVSDGVSYGNLLSMDSLLGLLNNTLSPPSGSHKTLTLGPVNMAKFTGDYEYVKKTGVYLDRYGIDITSTIEQFGFPEYGGYTPRVVWCSAEDEDAMTVVDYMAEKGWTLA